MPLNNKSKIKGTYFPPGDKSISHRIIILAGQTVGKSEISNLLEGEDVINTLKAMRLMGALIEKKDYKYIVFGVPLGGLFQPSKPIDFGNSGTGIRLISGLISSNNIRVKLIGDKSLSKRPMKRVTEHLSKIGADISLRKDLYTPIKLKGTGKAGDRVVSAGNGEARVAELEECTAFNTIGRLIKHKYNKETTLTECVIGVK